MTLIFKAKQTIEFIGDSVTDSGRRDLPFCPTREWLCLQDPAIIASRLSRTQVIRPQ